MEEVIRREFYKGYTINVYRDDVNGESPRDWDNLGTMVCFHRRYNLGDEHNFTVEEARGIMEDRSIVSLPLYLYDHSGLTMNTTGFQCPWDSGQVGFIYVSKEDIRKEMARPKPLKKGQVNPDLASIKRVTKKDIERVRECLKGEVETYDQYLTGEVYGYSIVKSGEESDFVDSCWGFYGDPEGYMIPECKSVIDNLAD